MGAAGLVLIDTGAGIQVPVGPEILGRMFDVVGQPIDQKPDKKVHATISI